MSARVDRVRYPAGRSPAPPSGQRFPRRSGFDGLHVRDDRRGPLPEVDLQRGEARAALEHGLGERVRLTVARRGENRGAGDEAATDREPALAYAPACGTP